jgi:HrpA-like RNA helicase
VVVFWDFFYWHREDTYLLHEKQENYYLSNICNCQVQSTIEYICRNEGDGAILVFLTGWDEISKLLDMIKSNNFLGNPSKFLVLPLHGSMPTVNQREIFDRPPNGIR